MVPGGSESPWTGYLLPPIASSSSHPPPPKRQRSSSEDSPAMSQSGHHLPEHLAQHHYEAEVKPEEDGGKGKKKAAVDKGVKPPLPRGNACSTCRRRKLRCDGLRPKCNTCIRLNHDCTYGDPIHEKLQERARELEARVRSLEDELEQYRLGPAPANGREPPIPHASSSATSLSPAEQPRATFPSLAPAHPDAYPHPLQHPPHLSQNEHSYHQAHPSPSSIPSPFVYSSEAPAAPHPTGLSAQFSQTQSYHPHSHHVNQEGFPIPPPLHHHHQHQHQHQHPMQQQPHNGFHPQVPLAHLQSFPFTMNHPNTPQLSDLMNSPQGPGPGLGGQPHQFSSTPLTASPANENGASSSSHFYPPPPPSVDHSRGSPSTSYHGGEYENGRTVGTGEHLRRMVDVQEWGERGGGLATSWTSELPSIEVLLDLANIYFLTTHVHFPFLQRPRFLYSLNHPSSLSSPPSLSLIFAVLAIAAPYHDSPSIRALAPVFYSRARAKVEFATAMGVQPSGRTIATLTVEMVQSLCLLTMIEMGKCDYQRAFLSIGQAVRIATMLGLHRMDEDRLAGLLGTTSDRRLRPPALHQLPSDPLLLEECRRTMCTVFCLDRFESACVGWPSAISENDIRLLLPCDERRYESGTCAVGDNPTWWPLAGGALKTEEEQGSPPLGSFAWLCRVVWLGGRIQGETYGPSGGPADGPWNKNAAAPMEDVKGLLEMDAVLEATRAKLNALASQGASKGVNGALIMALVVLNCNFVTLFHLHVGRGLSALPFNPAAPVVIGTPEYSLQRCLKGIHSLHEILSQVAAFENARTSLHRSRITTFTSFVPYVLYCIAFPAKFLVGDWSILVSSRTRNENVPGRVITGPTGPAMPSGDDVFGPGLDDERLMLIDTFCDAMDRVGLVWSIGIKFASAVRGDRMRLAARALERHSPGPQGSSSARSQASY